MCCLGFSCRRAPVFIWIYGLPWVAFFIITAWRSISRVRREISKSLLREALWLPDRGSRLVDLFSFASLRSVWHVTGSSSVLGGLSLKVATPSTLSRDIFALFICGPRMSIIWSKWNVLMTYPIISERFSSDSKAWK